MTEIIDAYNDNRGRTAPVSLTTGSLTLDPAPNAYANPLLLPAPHAWRTTQAR